MHSAWRTYFKVVVCCAPDTARLCDRFCHFSPIGCGSRGLAPLSPDRLRHVCPLSPPTHPLPLQFLFSSPSSPNWRGVHITLWMLSFHCLPDNLYCVGGDVKPCSIQSNPLKCALWAYPQPFHRRACDTFENRSFERLLKPDILYFQCMLRDSHCYFSAVRLKSGGMVPPTPKKWGIRVPPVPPESYAYGCAHPFRVHSTPASTWLAGFIHIFTDLLSFYVRVNCATPFSRQYAE